MKHIKEVLIGLSVFPMAVLFFIIFAHIASLIDPILTFFIGGGFWLLVVIVLVKFGANMKDFIVSIFKKDKGTNDKGFKNF